MDIIQVSIFVFGLIAIFLTQQPNVALQKYACIFGLISQPFFLYSTYLNDQVGMFLLSICYTLIWGLGFKNYWLGKNKQRKTSITRETSIESYLTDLECIRGIIEKGYLDQLYGITTKQQMLDLLNDAQMVGDPEYCSSALISLKSKILKIGFKRESEKLNREDVSSITTSIDNIIESLQRIGGQGETVHLPRGALN